MRGAFSRLHRALAEAMAVVRAEARDVLEAARHRDLLDAAIVAAQLGVFAFSDVRV